METAISHIAVYPIPDSDRRNVPPGAEATRLYTFAAKWRMVKG
jgi:hypothetical protein